MEDEIIARRIHHIIEEEIRGKGPITFAEFMEICLYHPQYGYYSSGRARRGREGDYFTSPTVHPIFGALLGKQIGQTWKILGGGDFEVVEMGGGEGYLCHDLLGYLRGHEPQLYELLCYRMVEISPPVIERQKEILAPFDGKVSWCRPGELGKDGIVGCFLSNELVDSFPVHRVVMVGGALKEIFVALKDGRLRELLGEPSTPELEEYFRRLGITLRAGQRAEVNLEAMQWLRRVARGLEKGFVITIDYGYPAQELYSPDRSDGTLLCYRDHRVLSDPYVNLGLQDMTSHVDFTSLIHWGEELGLRYTGLVPQYRFLLALGILEEMTRVGDGKGEQEAMAERLTIKNLILPGGMGGHFQVLIQHKGVERPQLDGLERPLDGGEQWSARKSSVL